MRAIQLSQHGPAEHLHLVEPPDVHPHEGQVRVAVAGAGVHVVDTVLRQGVQRGPIPLNPLPTIPGREVAGTVDEVGEGVDHAWLGRRVVAHLGGAPGGYASQALVALESLHVVPDGLHLHHALAMVGTGRMAVSIAEIAALRADDVLLLTGAAGGIGTLLVQIAKAAGAFVIGLASAGKLELVRANGADVAIDVGSPSWTEALSELPEGRGISVAIDGIGGATGRSVMEALAVGGRFVIIGFVGDNTVTQVTSDDLVGRGIVATAALGARTLQRPGGLRRLETEALELAATGAVTPLIDAHPLADAARAHRSIEQRRSTGKVVLVP